MIDSQAMPSDRAAFIRRYLDDLSNALKALPVDSVDRALAALERAHLEGRQVFLAGNGGSAATASHMACDLVWSLAQAGVPGLRAVALADNLSLVTAVANDTSYDEIFARPISQLAKPGDVLVAISGSGNSRNVVRAVETARAMGVATIGFLGMDGGSLKPMVDVAVVVPSRDYGIIEDVHLALDHLTAAWLRDLARARART